MPGARDEMPTISVEHATGHPLLRGLIKFGDDFGVLIQRNDTLYGIVRLPDIDGVIETAARFTDANELYAWWATRRWASQEEGRLRIYDDALDALSDLRGEWQGKFLYMSPREPTPAGRGLVRYMREPGDPNEQLCRDDDCDGQHAWVVQLGVDREFSYIWHLNLRSCAVVPPDPMVIGR